MESGRGPDGPRPAPEPHFRKESIAFLKKVRFFFWFGGPIILFLNNSFSQIEKKNNLSSQPCGDYNAAVEDVRGFLLKSNVL